MLGWQVLAGRAKKPRIFPNRWYRCRVLVGLKGKECCRGELQVLLDLGDGVEIHLESYGTKSSCEISQC